MSAGLGPNELERSLARNTGNASLFHNADGTNLAVQSIDGA
jgi:hypothetical protein